MGGDVGEENCETCEATGTLGSACCEAPIRQDATCAKCGEETEPGKCPDCGGTGYVEFSISERKREAKEAAAEARWEERREQTP